MAYQKLTEAQEEQIRNMHDDGKSAKEVVDFFKETYQIKLPIWKVSYIISKKSGGVASDEKPRRRAAQRKYARKISAPVEVTAKDDFALHIHAAFDIHKKDFVPRVMKELEKVC